MYQISLWEWLFHWPRRSWRSKTFFFFLIKYFLFLFLYIRHELQQRVAEKESEKQEIQEDTKGLTEKSNQLAEEMKGKNEALKNVEK